MKFNQCLFSLDFVIKGKHIEASQDPKLRQPAKHPKQQQREVGKSHQQPEHRTDRRQLLTEICSDFFSENAPNPIPLTNQVRNPIWNGWSFRRIFNFCQYNMVSISLLSLLVALIKLRGATMQQNVF